MYGYGEPASQAVTDRWGSVTALFHRALTDAGYLVYPNRTHPIADSEGRGTTAHVYQMIARYFVTNLPAARR